MSAPTRLATPTKVRGVLVTAATTPVGAALVRHLVADEGVAHILAVGAEPREDALPDVTSPKVTYLRVDLTRARDVRGLLFGPARDLAIEAVVHGALHRNPVDAGRHVHRLNVECTRELLTLAERHPTIRQFVFRSDAQVYRVDGELPDLIEEDHPLDLSPDAPQWVRDRVEADVTVCLRIGRSPLCVTVLRAAEVLALDAGSQLHDYLQSRVCLRPLGYDPMLNVLSVADAVRAVVLALDARVPGVFNVPGKATMPLSTVIERGGGIDVPIPGLLLGPLYALRRLATQHQFRYDMNEGRFHFTGVLDGHRAQEELGYAPRVGV